MRIFRTPGFIRKIYPEAYWKIPQSEKIIYLTFDDGPIPELTPWVLEILERFTALATFFCVGDNVRKYPEIAHKIILKGHSIGNHTFHHIKGWNTRNQEYFQDIFEASELIKSPLFRPPYGQIKKSQYNQLKKNYRIILWDLITYDYDPGFSPKDCLSMLYKKTESGSIIVFHDSKKAEKNLRAILPNYLEFLRDNGFTCLPIPLDLIEGHS